MFSKCKLCLLFILLGASVQAKELKSPESPGCWVQGQCQGVPLETKEVMSRDECLKVCRSLPNCQWTTLSSNNICSLYQECGAEKEPCQDCWSAKQLLCDEKAGLIILVGGSGPAEGNVYATNPATGTFGPVCDDLWDILDANVVCRQLGYSSALNYFSGSYFGQVPDVFSYDSLMCTGQEMVLDDCDHDNIDDCGASEGAGVQCDTSNVHRVDLLGGAEPNEGNVFARNPITDVYGPVCDDAWDINDANVVCRQLGFEFAQDVLFNSHFGLVTDRFSYDDVNCYGSESTLDACSHANTHNCQASEGAGVICYIDRPTTPSPQDGVYLVGGSSSGEGNVYAFNPDNGVDGPVCDDDWDESDAAVVCKQLGFSRVSQIYSNSYFGLVSDVFSYDHIRCNGYESRLSDCPYENVGIGHCRGSEGAGIVCQ